MYTSTRFDVKGEADKLHRVSCLSTKMLLSCMLMVRRLKMYFDCKSNCNDNDYFYDIFWSDFAKVFFFYHSKINFFLK